MTVNGDNPRPSEPYPHEISQILNAIHGGNRQASEQLLPLVYDELRELAAFLREQSEQTLQPTALVHEAYVRYLDRRQVQIGTGVAISSRPPRRPCVGFSWKPRQGSS